MEFVQRLAMDLQGAGVDVWWDLSDIQGSDVWERKIEEGLRNSQYFIVVLTPASLESRWVRREYLSADNRGVKIIPLRLKPYDEVPLTLRDIQPIEAIGRSYEVVLSDVLRILNVQTSDLVGAKHPKSLDENTLSRTHVKPSVSTTRLELAGGISLLSFLLFLSFALFDDSSGLVIGLTALFGLAAGFFLLRERSLPQGFPFKLATSLFLSVYSIKLLNDVNGWEIFGLEIVTGVVTVVLAIVILISMQSPKKNAVFTSLFLAVFIFLASIQLGANAFGEYPVWQYTPTVVFGVITAILLWRDF
jgi:hypothetical protein